MSQQKRQVGLTGSSFIKHAGDYIARLKPKQQVRLEREPGNQYHSNAVAVYTFQQKLGYLPRGFADIVAPIMDAGGTVTATKSADPKFAQTGVLLVAWEAPDAETDAGADR
jgi:hypothetical protein